MLFDRSWYNRAGVEPVMGFCSPEETTKFLAEAPQFERMLVNDGIHLFKFWLSIGREMQMKRFHDRRHDPLKRWKLSTTDLYSRSHWVDYSRAKDEMFIHTDIPEARWHVVPSDHKRNARINCISHLLSMVPYEPRPVPEIEMPPRQRDEGYVRPPRDMYTYVPDHSDEALQAWKRSK